MDILYGEGEYKQGDICCRGKIILTNYKLYLKGPGGDLTQTYLSLDKISKLKKGRSSIELEVRLSQANQYQVTLKMESVHIKDFVETLVKRLGLRKKFFIPVWVGEVSWK